MVTSRGCLAAKKTNTTTRPGPRGHLSIIDILYGSAAPFTPPCQRRCCGLLASVCFACSPEMSPFWLVVGAEPLPNYIYTCTLHVCTMCIYRIVAHTRDRALAETYILALACMYMYNVQALQLSDSCWAGKYALYI